MRRTAGNLIVFLFATLTFIANAAGDETSISHVAHLSAAYGPLLACGDCHNVSSMPLLKDGQNLAGTSVCNPCHSPGGIYNGVDSNPGNGSVGARDNWDTGVYSNGELASGKEKWCVGCHDDAPSVVNGVSAPNIAGSESGKPYGFYITGHGKHGYEQAITCLTCHDASRGHVDGDARTYSAAAKNYQAGFRLKSVNGKPPLDVPRTASGAITDKFLLCFSCHDSTPFLTKGNTDTNFRADVYDTCVPLNLNLDLDASLVNKHWYHLQASNAFKRWDSDWDGAADSLINCTACHNVHGPRLKNAQGISHAPAMIRTGEEMGRASSLNLDYLVNPCPDWSNNAHSPTNELSDSTGGVMKFQGPARGSIAKNHVCIMCHNEYQPYFREPKEILGCDNCHAFGSHQTHVRSTAEGGMLGIDCGQCHDTDHFPQFVDHQDRANTTVCTPCHSADGAALAKQYWANPGNWVATEGEASYCGSCHDATPGYNGATAAFNVMGDKTTYGFYVTGHGKASGAYARLSWQDTAATGNPAAQKGCGACHDLASRHFNNAGKRLKAGFGNDQANTNCNQCHADGKGATNAPQWYTTSADYEASAHGGKLCTNCHDVHGVVKSGQSYSTTFAGMTRGNKQALCYQCHTDGMVQNNAISGASLADSIQDAFNLSTRHQFGANFVINSKSYYLECVSCHNVHVVTGKYWDAASGKTPVSRFSNNTAAWGGAAGQKMNDYAGSGYYQVAGWDADLGANFPGSVLPDYDTFCLDCHSSGVDAPFGIDWNGNPHGRESANLPHVEGHAPPNWYLSVSYAEGWDGDDALDPAGASWPVIPRARGQLAWTRSPYDQERRIEGGNFVLSCTTCHEAHGSNSSSMQRIIDGPETSVPGVPGSRNGCSNCHWFYAPWHYYGYDATQGEMGCGTASCHETFDLHRQKKDNYNYGTVDFNRDLVADIRFDGNLKDSGAWNMHGRGFGSYEGGGAGTFGANRLGQANKALQIDGNQPVEIGTEDNDWSTFEGILPGRPGHGTWKYTEMKYHTTLEAWVYPTDNANNEYIIFTKQDWSQDGYTLALKKINSTLRAVFNMQADNNGPVQGGAAGRRGAYSSIAIPINKWTHIAATFNTNGPDRNPADPAAGRIRIYVNGLDVTTSDTAGSNIQPGAGETSIFNYSENSPWNPDTCQWCASPFSIGGYMATSGSRKGLIGGIDDVKVWNVTKDAAYFSAYDAQAGPYISSVSGAIGSNQLTVVFSEGIYTSTGASGALMAGDFSLNDVGGNNPRSISLVTHTAGSNIATITMSQPLVSADANVDTIAAVSNSIYDAYNNPAGTEAVTISASLCPPSGLITFDLNETAGSTYAYDTSGILKGAVNNPGATFTGNGYLNGNGTDTYIKFTDFDSCMTATTAMTIEARIKPIIPTGTIYAYRIFSKENTNTSNYQLSVWRNDNTTVQDPPTQDEAMIAFWVAPTDIHSGLPWKMALTDFNNANCKITNNNWYKVKVVWNSAKPSGIPVDIYIDKEQGAGYVNCTDSDQSQVPSSPPGSSRILYTGDTIYAVQSDSAIGTNANSFGSSTFNGQIDWITWKDSVD